MRAAVDGAPAARPPLPSQSKPPPPLLHASTPATSRSAHLEILTPYLLQNDFGSSERRRLVALEVRAAGGARDRRGDKRLVVRARRTEGRVGEVKENSEAPTNASLRGDADARFPPPPPDRVSLKHKASPARSLGCPSRPAALEVSSPLPTPKNPELSSESSAAPLASPQCRIDQAEALRVRQALHASPKGRERERRDDGERTRDVDAARASADASTPQRFYCKRFALLQDPHSKGTEREEMELKRLRSNEIVSVGKFGELNRGHADEVGRMREWRKEEINKTR